MGRYSDARSWLLKARQRYAEKNGADHVRTLTAQIKLAQLEWKAGKVPQAIAGFEAVIRGLEKIGRAESHEIGIARRHLAAAYLAAGRLDAAESHASQAVEILKKVPGPTHADTRKAMALADDIRKKRAGVR
jgi:tetratricopeptide (TPR) repeat protein